MQPVPRSPMCASVTSALLTVLVWGPALLGTPGCNRIDYGHDRPSSPTEAAAGGSAAGAPLEELVTRAEAGEAGAQYELAAHYAEQETTQGSDAAAAARALVWYTRAADQGHALASWELGERIATGTATPGVGPDPSRAVPLWRRAAEAGVPEAQLRLGEAFEQGLGVTADASEALRFYRMAAEQGLAVARHRLASIYDAGVLVPRDASEAATWYRLAAEQGYAPSQARLGRMYALGDGIPPRSDEAVQWARRAAEADDADGCNSLALFYLKGLGVEQSFDQALHWYRKAADLGDASARNMLGTLYLTGHGGLARDPVEAEKWWRLAAEQGHAKAQYNLGGMYSRHLSATLSRQEALDWLGRAAEQGHRAAARERAELEGASIDALIEETGEGDDAL